MGACWSKGSHKDTADDYTSMVQKVEQLQVEVKDKIEQQATAEASVKKALGDIAKHRVNINAYFDKIESTLVAKCGKITSLNGLEAAKNNDTLTDYGERLNTVHEHLTSNIDNFIDLFARADEVRPLIVDLEREIKTINKTELQCIEFVKNVSLTSEWSLGELQVSTIPVFLNKQRKRLMKMTVQYKADISVVDSSDRLGLAAWCKVSGLVHVRENIIACTDWNKLSVKLVDVKQGKVLSTALVMGSTWDITSISHDTLAVTITPCRQIQFLEVKNDILTLKGVIDVNGACRGIDSKDDKIVVSYDEPPKVEIIDFHGNVLKVIQTDNNGTDLFMCPWYVVFSQCGRSIYVSNVFGRPITKFTIDGTVQASYKGSELEDTRGMCAGRNGSVFVCSTTAVRVMTGDCKIQKTLITRKNDVRIPTGICLDEYNGVLCVSKFGDFVSDDVIQTFEIK